MGGRGVNEGAIFGAFDVCRLFTNNCERVQGRAAFDVEEKKYG